MNSVEQDQAIADLQQRVSAVEEAIIAIRKFLDRDLPAGISRDWTTTTADPQHRGPVEGPDTGG